MDDLIERLQYISSEFYHVLDLGAHHGQAGCALSARGVRTHVHADLAHAYAVRRPDGALGLVADEECLPFKPASFDVIVSCLSLHWVNDLPGTLCQIRACLRPGGVFIGSMFGGATLNELRHCLIAAESAVRSGAAQRVSPFADARDLANLLQRAGFADPVADSEKINVTYAQPWRLLDDLRAMGETACPERPAPPLTTAILVRAMDMYQQRFANADGRIRACFEIVTASAWAPSATSSAQGLGGLGGPGGLGG